MTETNDKDGRKSLSLNKPLEAKKSAGGNSQVRQSFTHGRSKTVQVEVRKKRSTLGLGGQKPATAAPATTAGPKKTLHVAKTATDNKDKATKAPKAADKKDSKIVLTSDEKAARTAALAGAREQSIRDAEERKVLEEAKAREEKLKAAEEPQEETPSPAEPAKTAKRRSPEERRKAEEEGTAY